MASLLGAHFSALAEKQIRVRLHHRLAALELVGRGLKVIADGEMLISESVLLDGMIKIQRRSNHWEILRENPKIIVSTAAARIVVRGEKIYLGEKQLPNRFEVRPSKKGLEVVAELPLEVYLKGVVPEEMPASWPLEALKAQAVAARSFALRRAEESRKRSFDVDASIVDQVYKFSDENALLKSFEKAYRAVQETRGEVLLDKRRKILKAFYSADCGCQSEDPRFVWGQLEDFKSVKDPSCKKRKPLDWSLSLKRQQIRHALNREFDLPATTSLRAIHVAGRTPSGRVSEVVAVVDVQGKRRRQSIPSQQFRRIIGFDKMLSTQFSLHWLANELTIRGQGMGHGVGLCQTGARTLAEDGRSYRDILRLFYPNAELTRQAKN